MKRKLIYALLVILIISFSTVGFANQEINKEKAVELALKQNSEIQKLRKEIEKTQAQLEEAEGAFYPTIDLGTSYTRFENKRQLGAGVSSNDSYNVSLDLKQPLFLGGELRINYQMMKNRLQMTKLNLEQKKEEITYQVLKQYYNVLKAKKMLNVREQQLKQNKRYVEVARANKEVGTHTKTDLLQAKVSYNQAQQEKLVAENNLETAKLALKNTLNLADDKNLTITDSLSWEQKKFKLDEVYDYALNNKVAFKLLKLQKETAELDLQSKKNRDIYPDVNLLAGYEATDDHLSVDGNWQTTLSISYNIFNGGRDQDKIKQKEKELEKVKIDEKQTKDDIKLAIKNSLLNLRAARDRIKLSKLNLKQAEENLDDNEFKFKEGLITSLDLLNVQTSYQQVKMQYYQAIYDYNLAVAELNKAMGKIEELN
ncbi:TolC family protein [Halanaerobacter jeridensis]|uniref:Outer membrane protein TolC n=1 Tax=Halanaerobacter jeridensis TaxID=706427 RepID=A0A938XTP2_9FIRM|nr:TolC family protein [Halanaerobacter jeridensis]MBM7557335.1 outer membrane protein TolC [Halanaerobacter jeridensis]